ncbi:MAG TPA: LssY C-terminal domain-containing protein [Rhodoblastus sp.]|nr:LssY C-terminal domain-containing protein [Rhodoblastus sp.]
MDAQIERQSMGSTPPAHWRDRRSRIARAIGLGLILWAGLAYLALPVFWRHEDKSGLAGRAMVTRTSADIPGDPINFGIVGSESDVVCAFNAAGWSAANPTTLDTALRIVGSVALRRPYPAAPVSPLYYDGRREDLAFEKSEGGSADRRHHIRLWRVAQSDDGQRPSWLGSASFDRGVGFSHYTLQVTHHIAPNVDAERAFVAEQLASAGMVENLYEIAGVGPTLDGRNGGGDRYFTDGEAAVVVLSPDCRERADKTPARAGDPWQRRFKDAIWSALRRVMGAMAS